ncbi:MAG: FliI/YscN family ATPase, partial [Pseudomonadota bacterium]
MSDPFSDLAALAETRPPVTRRCGAVAAASGATVEVTGLAGRARLGDPVHIGENLGDPGVAGEIVALSADRATAMISGGDDGIALGDRVWLAPQSALAPNDAWLGRVVDAHGAPLDGGSLAEGETQAPIHGAPPAAMTRGGLGPRLATGLAALDALLPIARGQRVGLFAGSGVGKSRLLARLARRMEADVVVFALIGERGRELNDFIRNGLGEEGFRRSVVVAATSDESPLTRRRAAWTATAIAESFRDQGRHVLLIFDSLTRFAEAHREIALTAGETPSLRAYPPSTSSMIARLTERAGPGRADRQGAITAIYSVLVAGSDMEEPVADITRGLLDGHIVLDRAIAERGRFPAIDAARSVSRSLPEAASEEENALIKETRRCLTLYEEAAPMVRTGLYQAGADPETDRAVALFAELDAFFAKSLERRVRMFARLG